MFTAAGNGGLSGYNRRARVESTANGFGESPMPRQNAGYGGYGYTPTGVDTTPQKPTRQEYSITQPSQPALSEVAEPLRARAK